MKSGFDPYKLPSAEYLLDCIYALDPNNEIFKFHQKTSQRSFPL